MKWVEADEIKEILLLIAAAAFAVAAFALSSSGHAQRASTRTRDTLLRPYSPSTSLVFTPPALSTNPGASSEGYIR